MFSDPQIMMLMNKFQNKMKKNEPTKPNDMEDVPEEQPK